MTHWYLIIVHPFFMRTSATFTQHLPRKTMDFKPYPSASLPRGFSPIPGWLNCQFVDRTTIFTWYEPPNLPKTCLNHLDPSLLSTMCVRLPHTLDPSCYWLWPHRLSISTSASLKGAAWQSAIPLVISEALLDQPGNLYHGILFYTYCYASVLYMCRCYVHVLYIYISIYIYIHIVCL